MRICGPDGAGVYGAKSSCYSLRIDSPTRQGSQYERLLKCSGIFSAIFEIVRLAAPVRNSGVTRPASQITLANRQEVVESGLGAISLVKRDTGTGKRVIKKESFQERKGLGRCDQVINQATIRMGLQYNIRLLIDDVFDIDWVKGINFINRAQSPKDRKDIIF